MVFKPLPWSGLWMFQGPQQATWPGLSLGRGRAICPLWGVALWGHVAKGVGCDPVTVAEGRVRISSPIYTQVPRGPVGPPVGTPPWGRLLGCSQRCRHRGSASGRASAGRWAVCCLLLELGSPVCFLEETHEALGVRVFLEAAGDPPPLPTIPAPLTWTARPAPASLGRTVSCSCLPAQQPSAQWQRVLLQGSRRGSLGPEDSDSLHRTLFWRPEAGPGTLPLSVFCLLEWSQH